MYLFQDDGASEHQTPFMKRYFSKEMMEKYEPLQDAMQKVLDSDGADDEAWNEFTTYYKKYQGMEVFSNWDGKRYDMVFYGVSGYTGYLMMEYVKRYSLKVTPETFTFAFAGRTASKVAALRDRLFQGHPNADTPVMAMNYDDIVSVLDLAKSARCIINVAGPYMLTEGEILVDACCQTGTNYLDISGEIPWTLRLLKLHERCKENGMWCLPSSATAGGYPDLEIFLMAKKIREEFGEELKWAETYCTGGGAIAGASGGTLKTRAAMAGAGDEVRAAMGNFYSLGGFVPDRDRNGIKEVNVEFGTGKVTCKTRAIDRDANMAKITENKKLGIWRGPYVYQYFDTRIVRRSNAMFADMGNCPYGRELSFLEFSLIPMEAIMEMKGSQGTAAASVADEKEALKAKGLYYEAGEGPPLEILGDAWTGIFSIAESTGGKEEKVCMIGKDGYLETARMCVEAATCLLFDRDKMPFRGGVTPPTVACQTCLAERLIATGMKFKMGEWLPRDEWNPPPFP